MTPLAPSTAPGAERPPGRIAHDVACVGCGYNLRTLREDGECPECGLAVSRTVRGDRLELADRAWLRRLHRGLGMMHFEAGAVFWVGLIGLMVLPVVLLLVWFYLFAWPWLRTAAGWLMVGVFCGLGLLVLAVAVSTVAGAFMLTSPDPEALPDAPSSKRVAGHGRRSRKWLVWLLVMLAVMCMAAGLPGVPGLAGVPGVGPVIEILTAAAAVGWLHTFAGWLGWLARRAPDTRAVKACRSARHAGWVLGLALMGQGGLMLWIGLAPWLGQSIGLAGQTRESLSTLAGVVAFFAGLTALSGLSTAVTRLRGAVGGILRAGDPEDPAAASGAQPGA